MRIFSISNCRRFLPISVSIVTLVFLFDLLWHSLARVFFIVYFRPSALDLPLLHSLSTLIIGLRFDAKVFAFLYLPLYLLAAGLVYLRYSLPKVHYRVWQLFFLAFTLAMLLLLVFDWGHYAYLGTRLDWGALRLISDKQVALDFLWNGYPVFWLGLILIFVCSALVWVKLLILRKVLSCFDKNQFSKTSGWWNKLLKICFILAFAGLWILVAHGRFSPAGLTRGELVTLPHSFLQEAALNPWFKAFDNYGLSFLRVTDPNEISSVQNWRTSRLQHQAAVSSKSPYLLESPPPKPNVVLIFQESYAAQRTGRNNPKTQISPRFDQLANQGLLFSRFFSNGNVTMRGIFATLSSIPDLNYDWVTEIPGLEQQTSLINQFSGYKKHYFIGGDPNWGGLKAYLKNTISDLTIHDQSAFDAPRVNSWGISDRDLLLQSTQKLTHETEPFFAIIQTAHNHTPYGISAIDRQRLPPSPTSQQWAQDGFRSLAEIQAWQNYDNALGDWQQLVQSQPWFDRTLFVLVGDHGVRLNFPKGKSNPVIDAGLAVHHTPLLFWAPRWLKAQEQLKVGTQVDILPTILDLLGRYNESEAQSANHLGQSLLRPSQPEVLGMMLINADDQTMGAIVDDHLITWRRSQPTTQGKSQALFSDRPLAAKSIETTISLMKANDWVARWLVDTNAQRKQP